MVKNITKKEIREFIKGITYSNKKGLVLHEVRIYIYNGKVEKIVRYVGDKQIKYDKSTNIVHLIEEYLNKKRSLKDTIDIIYDYTKEMIEEYNEESKELEFYKKIDNK